MKCPVSHIVVLIEIFNQNYLVLNSSSKSIPYRNYTVGEMVPTCLLRNTVLVYDARLMFSSSKLWSASSFPYYNKGELSNGVIHRNLIHTFTAIVR